jgi:hypothetical protein
MRHPGGTAVSWDKEGRIVEQYDTFNCAHCGVTVLLKGGKDPSQDGSIAHPQPHWKSDGMGVCLQCNDGYFRGLLCPTCHEHQNKHGGCKNFEKRLEQMERRSRLLNLVK